PNASFVPPWLSVLSRGRRHWFCAGGRLASAAPILATTTAYIDSPVIAWVQGVGQELQAPADDRYLPSGQGDHAFNHHLVAIHRQIGGRRNGPLVQDVTPCRQHLLHRD